MTDMFFGAVTILLSLLLVDTVPSSLEWGGGGVGESNLRFPYCRCAFTEQPLAVEGEWECRHCAGKIYISIYACRKYKV